MKMLLGNVTTEEKTNREEIGGVYLPSQLERVHQNYLARDGRWSE
jgi:hypothetical protein